MRQLQPLAPNTNKQGLLLRAILLLIALHVVWTVGCAWIEVHSNSGAASSVGGLHVLGDANHRSAFRARAEWWLKYEDREDGNQQEDSGGIGRNAEEEQYREADGAGISTKWSFDPSNVRAVQSALLKATGRKSLPLRAYAEPPLPPQPPKVSVNATKQRPRLAVRTHSPEDLTMYEYPKIQTCSDIPKFMPTGHPSSDDGTYGPNTYNQQPLYPLRHDYARDHCPVDADPFLPWVHDVFPSNDGRYIEFVAHNKRRCNTDPRVFWDDIVNLEAQVAIMQPVPVKRLDGGEEEARRLQPRMWMPDSQDESKQQSSREAPVHRYRLASHEEADEDGIETRFICRFHTLRLGDSNEESGAPRLDDVILGETLSVAPYSYELLNYRKPGSQPMLTRPEGPTAKGGSGAAPHNSAVWNAMHHFRCSVPENLVDVIKNGSSVMDDIPSIYVDVVPMRTYPRDTREGYIKGVAPEAAERFDPDLEWGRNHILPRVEASGRWTNFPVCRPPIMEANSDTKPDKGKEGKEGKDKDYLIGCTWASAAYTTRGDDNLDTSTSERMLEWLTFNFEVAGFDHIYIFDNTAAYTDTTSLAPITDLFSDRVTRIEWPHRICNNNRPAHSNTGERSSQYTAENSCRMRYGSSAEWLANFDSDEYFVPVGQWNSIFEWLRDSVDKEKETHILSYFQTRAKPVAELMIPHKGDRQCKGSDARTDHPVCLAKNSSLTYLETYNCEPTPLPKPEDWAWRAKKQIYKPHFMLNHFVHYPMATVRINEHPGEMVPRFKAKHPYERRVNELTEGFMLHAKSTLPRHTIGWYDKCKASTDKCPVGFPHPFQGNGSAVTKELESQIKPNCYRNERIVKEIGPRLREALSKV